MRKLTTVLALGTLPAIAAPAHADDFQHWETVNISVALPEAFKISSETVLRTSDARGFYEVEQNVMLGKKLNKMVTVWLGYTFDPAYSHGNFVRREHRFRQQVSFDNFATIGKVKLSGRLRLEQRWREGISGTGWRLRPQIKASMPFVGKTTLSFASEEFIDLNNTAFQQVDDLERMRNSVTVTIPLSKKINLDVGYLNQHGFVPVGADTHDHVLTSGISASF